MEQFDQAKRMIIAESRIAGLDESFIIEEPLIVAVEQYYEAKQMM